MVLPPRADPLPTRPTTVAPDVPYVKPMDLKINLSTDGIATADLQNASVSADPVT